MSNDLTYVDIGMGVCSLSPIYNIESGKKVLQVFGRVFGCGEKLVLGWSK